MYRCITVIWAWLFACRIIGHFIIKILKQPFIQWNPTWCKWYVYVRFICMNAVCELILDMCPYFARWFSLAVWINWLLKTVYCKYMSMSGLYIQWDLNYLYARSLCPNGWLFNYFHTRFLKQYLIQTLCREFILTPLQEVKDCWLEPLLWNRMMFYKGCFMCALKLDALIRMHLQWQNTLIEQSHLTFWLLKFQ